MEKIYYKASDNVQLNGILEKNGSDTCIIMCHGIRSDKDEHGNFTKLAEVLNKNKIDSFRFDFRGHGENNNDSSTVTISGEIKDLEASIDIVSNMGYKNIILLGESFGGGIISLIDFKRFNNIKGLILWCPCLVYKETNIFCEENVNKALEDGFLETKSIKTGKKFIFSKELMLETKKYKPYDALLNNILPKLFIHGTNDEVVYYESVRECAKKSNNSELVTVEKGTHGFFDNIEHFNLVLSQTIEYIKKIIILEKVDK